MSAQHKQRELVRALGLAGAISIVIGTVIGGGVFLVPSAMMRAVGSVPTLFAVWVVAGVLSLFGALTYGELAAAMPEAGGEYVYLSKAYGPYFGFLYGWTQLTVAKSGSIATLATSFYTFLAVFYPALNKPVVTFPVHWGPNGSLLEIGQGQVIGIFLIVLLSALNYVGVRVGGGVQVAVTAVKLASLVAIIIAGLWAPAPHWPTQQPLAAIGGISGFVAAMVAALWAYDGWNNVAMVSSEVKNPRRNLPASLILGTVIVIGIYIAINIAYTRVLSPAQIAHSPRVAADMMQVLFGSGATKLISIAVLISVFAALNGSILSGSRVPYAMARDGYFFSAVAKVHPRFGTPSVSIIVLGVWSCLVLLTGRYDDLYNFLIFGSWILYMLAAASILVLRRKYPNMERPYRAIGYPVVPILFCGTALLLLWNTLLTRPRESLMGLLLMVAGTPFFLYWRRSAKLLDRPAEDLVSGRSE